LAGLGKPVELHEKMMAELSGKEKVRVLAGTGTIRLLPRPAFGLSLPITLITIRLPGLRIFLASFPNIVLSFSH
jgi:hypothetical protein